MTRLSLISAVLLCACSKPPAPANAEPLADVTLFGVRVIQESGNAVVLSGTATQLSWFKEPSGFEGYNGRFRLYGQEGFGDDLELKSPRFVWNVQNQLLSGQQGIHLSRPGYELKAQAFRLQLPQKVYEFEGSVWSQVGAPP